MSVLVPRRIAAPLEKAGPVGTGAGPLLTEYALPSILAKGPQERMREYAQLGIKVDWIRVAERVISGKFASLAWHLEDPEGETIDDKYPNAFAREAHALIEHPQANVEIGVKRSRSAMWWLMSRHQGITGQGVWYLDALDAYGVPSALMYIRPDRLTPKEDAKGNLENWVLDYNPRAGSGTPLELSSVMQVMFELPDEGHFGVGLVESGMAKAQLSLNLDRHVTNVLSSGGRLSGILGPKEGAITDDGIYAQLVRDWRNIAEQPDAARRLQVSRGPVEFTKTAADMRELRMIELLTAARDDLLALWGVPYSQVGGSSPAGLNSGDIRKYDEAALMQNAVEPRLTPFVEALQGQVLDRWKPLLGWAPKLVIDLPEFDDDSPRYDLLAKSVSIAMRNRERRALVGLEPFGADVLGPSGLPLDEEVWLPAGQTMATVAVAGNQVVSATAAALGRADMVTTAEGEEPAGASEAASAATNETSAGDAIKPAGKGPAPSLGKASIRDGLVALRSAVASTVTPQIKGSVSLVLRQQARDVASRIRTHYDHISAKPKDTGVWWDAAAWDKALSAALRPSLHAVADTVRKHVTREVAPALAPAKADPMGVLADPFALPLPGAIEYVLNHGAARVTAINERTRAALAAQIEQGIRDGKPPAQLADEIEAGVLENGRALFDEYRAELIARTELSEAYRDAELGSYGEVGVGKVEALDGDADEMCAARMGNVYTLDEAESEDEHPNGTLSWVPWIE